MIGSADLHHFISKQIVPGNKSEEILSFIENGSKTYTVFREERFLKKEKKLTDTIKQITMPQLSKSLCIRQLGP